MGDRIDHVDAIVAGANEGRRYAEMVEAASAPSVKFPSHSSPAKAWFSSDFFNSSSASSFRS